MEPKQQSTNHTDWGYAIGVLSTRFDEHEKQDERRHVTMNQDITDMKIEFARLGTKIALIGAAIVAAVPVITTLLSAFAHAPKP